MARSSGAVGSWSIFRWISERTLFSCPEVVWMAYQRWSTSAAREEAGDPAHEHLLQDDVEQRDDGADEEHDGDDADRRLADLAQVGPGHAAQFGHHVVVHLRQ